ncbi:DinB family protein [bacterium SCSIO 12741]|nr:DinB family protein [bacterium SCSIO 12741]
MNPSPQIAQHFRGVFFGGNWTTVNVKDTLAAITWKQALEQVGSFNTIATLSFHLSYFVHEVLPVLKGGPLTAHDKFSFDHPPIHSQEDWEAFQKEILKDAEEFATLVEQIPAEDWDAPFTDPKYGTLYRNIHGIIEHSHYHLGQIALIKKQLLEAQKK